MINLLDEVTPLLERQAEDSISIYIPTSPEWTKTEESKIYLKNNLNKITNKAHKELVDKIKQKTDSEEFWKKQSYGLGIFVSKNVEKYLQTPFPVTSGIHVGPYFNIKPLIDYLIESVEYYVIILNRNNVELLKCTNNYYEKVEVPSMPDSIKEIMDNYDPEKQMQFQSTVPGSKGSKSQSTYHGQGGYKGAEDKYINRFLATVANSISEQIASSEARIVYAGTEDHFYELKKISKLNLGDKIIPGSFDKPNYQEIVDEAWMIIKGENEEIRLKMLERHNNKSISDLTTTEAIDIPRLAQEGRVDTLFVKNQMQPNSSELSDTKHDILNYSMIHTLKNGGKVFRMKKDEFDTNVSFAALLRY
jgi:hypothetical protein